MIVDLDLYLEDYLKDLNISISQWLFILKAANIDCCSLASNEIIPNKEKALLFFKKDTDYLIFKEKSCFHEDFAYQYCFIEFSSFKEMDELVKKYIKLKAFI